MNTVFFFGATSHPSHNKNRKVLIMRLLKVFLGKVQKALLLLRKKGFRVSILYAIYDASLFPLNFLQ
ncbi:MAG: hypothetical protein A2007_06115 [Verrucomicrobia bacterium GWC2_42_7]|nr:MAG: hypothetical protein A2007_06115 [Verrucomicrobia bacterium GWC2_42_7]